MGVPHPGLKVLDLTTLEERRVRGDLIQAYRIITGKDEQFFKFRENANTGGNIMKLYKLRLKKSILQWSIS